MYLYNPPKLTTWEKEGGGSDMNNLINLVSTPSPSHYLYQYLNMIRISDPNFL